MTLTKQMIFAGRSSRGGWTKHQLQCLGVPRPPRTEIAGPRYARFLQLTKGGNADLPRLLQKDLNFRCWDDSPEAAANALYLESGRDLA